MKNGISKLVEELEEAQETVKEQHARVVELRRQLAEELGLHPGAPAVAVALVEKTQTNGTASNIGWANRAKPRKWPARVTCDRILVALGKRKLQSKEIADTVGVKRASVAYYLQALLDSGKIKRTGVGVYRRV